MNSLPFEYVPFKILYNTHKDKWSINELMTMCVQEKDKIVMEQSESAWLTSTREKNMYIKTDKSQAQKKWKFKIPLQGDIKKESKCYFCKKGGHMKKEYLEFKECLEKKYTLFSFVCYKSNMSDANINTWWIGFGSTIHITNSL